MTSTTIYTKFQNPIQRAGSDSLDELKITVSYEKGGFNYWNGQEDKRGIYAYFKPIYRYNGIESCILLGDQRESGFKVFIKSLARKSQKQIDNVFSAIMPEAKHFTDLYELGAYQQIVNEIFSKIA